MLMSMTRISRVFPPALTKWRLRKWVWALAEVRATGMGAEDGLIGRGTAGNLEPSAADLAHPSEATRFGPGPSAGASDAAASVTMAEERVRF